MSVDGSAQSAFQHDLTVPVNQSVSGWQGQEWCCKIATNCRFVVFLKIIVAFISQFVIKYYGVVIRQDSLGIGFGFLSIGCLKVLMQDTMCVAVVSNRAKRVKKALHTVSVVLAYATSCQPLRPGTAGS